uniref:Uncharacterized protein n=1 Tax=Anguilla anguilla TaxID=7936 RepID=A0A0E9X3K7_ANGAN
MRAPLYLKGQFCHTKSSMSFLFFFCHLWDERKEAFSFCTLHLEIGLALFKWSYIILPHYQCLDAGL